MELSLIRSLMSKEFYNDHRGAKCPDRLFSKDARKIKQSLDRAMERYSRDITPDEVQAYDQALESGNLNNINFALQALYYRYTDAVGSEGEMIQGKAAAPVDGFRSQQEVVRAMNDPRYENDPAYRQDVINKLDNSDLNF